MNLFTISNNPSFCIQSLDDVLLRKTILESAQILSTAIHVQKDEGIIEEDIPDCLYKSYNAGEEHNVWARESQLNYRWTFYYLLAGLDELKYRFNDTHDAALRVVPYVSKYEKYFPNVPMTPFPRKFNQSYENYRELMEMPDTFRAYKEYLITKWNKNKEKIQKEGKEDKRIFSGWTKREQPEFYKG